MNVLSLFDGMSCGQIALNRAEISYENYFASEIDKYAIEVTQHNYPNTKHIGNVLNVKGESLLKIDLLIGGSPCQNLSMAVISNLKCNKGLQGEKSKLFYEYLRVLKEVRPTYFLFENVGGMTEKNKSLINYALGVGPIMINSNLISAQDRERYYWTNIPINDLPENKNIVLKDIVQEEVDPKYWYKETFDYKGDNEKIQAILHLNGHDILKRVYNLNNKCGTLTCCTGGNKQKKVYQKERCRKLTPLEYERLQTVPDNYSNIVSDSQRYNLLGNGWTVDVIVHILKGMKTGEKKRIPFQKKFVRDI